jgi:hypothetical protein
MHTCRLSVVSRPWCDVLTRVRVIIRMGTAHGSLESQLTYVWHERMARARGHEETWAPFVFTFGLGSRRSHLTRRFSRGADVESYTRKRRRPTATGRSRGFVTIGRVSDLPVKSAVGVMPATTSRASGAVTKGQRAVRQTASSARAESVRKALRVPTRHGLRNSIPLERPEPPPASIWERRPARGVVRH